MLVKGLGLEALLGCGTDDDCGNLSSAVVYIGLGCLIESDDQQTTTLKRGTRDQRLDIGLQPGIRLGKRAVVAVVHRIWSDERKLRQRIIGQIGRELREWNYVRRLDTVVLHIR